MEATDIPTDGQLQPNIFNDAGDRIKYLGYFPYMPEYLFRIRS